MPRKNKRTKTLLYELKRCQKNIMLAHCHSVTCCFLMAHLITIATLSGVADLLNEFVYNNLYKRNDVIIYMHLSYDYK